MKILRIIAIITLLSISIHGLAKAVEAKEKTGVRVEGQLSHNPVTINLEEKIAAEPNEPNIFSELDKVFTKRVNDKHWGESSKELAKVMWRDFKAAHIESKQVTTPRNITDFEVDVNSYDEYIGRYTEAGSEKHKEYLEITKDEHGRFFVSGDDKKWPAVTANKLILFSNGTLTYLPIPRFGDKYYGVLEIYAVGRSKGDT